MSSAAGKALRQRLNLPEWASDDECEEIAIETLDALQIANEPEPLTRIKRAFNLDPALSEEGVLWFLICKIRFPGRPDLLKCDNNPKG
jgi:hypothetical protein